MELRVNPGYTSWQSKTIHASTDFRSVFLLGAVVAWFFFLWQVMALPPFLVVQQGLNPLARSALDKGQFMPDFGAILAGLITFHFRREFVNGLESKVARKVTFAVIAGLLVPLVVTTLIIGGIHLAAGHAVVPPWQDPLFHIQFIVVTTAIVAAVLVSPCLFVTWTGTPDISWAAVVLAAIFYGLMFHLNGDKVEWMWPARIVADLIMGLALCGTLFRGAQYFVAVRGTIIIIGIIGLLGGAILAGPGLFYLGFLMVAGGCALGERMDRLPGEGAILSWSRTAFAVSLAQAMVLTGWIAWGGSNGLPRLAVFGALVVITQLVAVLLYSLVERPVRSMLLRAVPAKKT